MIEAGMRGDIAKATDGRDVSVRRARSWLKQLSIRSVSLYLVSTVLLTLASGLSAQTTDTPTLKVSAREILIPVFATTQRQDAVDGRQQVLDLIDSEFHVFEDEQETRITSVHLEIQPDWGVKDDGVRHCVTGSLVEGIWSGQDIPLNYPVPCYSLEPIFHYYRIFAKAIGYTTASCHKIRVKADRPGVTLEGRTEYCDASSPSDPLGGTRIGKRLEAAANASVPVRIPVTGQAIAFAASSNRAIVHVSLQFPWQKFKLESGHNNQRSTINAGGVVSKRDGTLVESFSDPGPFSWIRDTYTGGQSTQSDEEGIYAGSSARYDRQLTLPPGDYVLKVAVTNGVESGRVELPITVPAYDGQQLTLSSIVLCKRFHRAEDAPLEAERRPPEYVPLTSQGVEFTPAGDTRFRKGERLLLWFQIQASSDADAPVDMARVGLTVVNLQTGHVQAETGLQDTAVPAGVPGQAIGILKMIAVNTYPPGQYRVQVRAVDPVNGNTATSSATFTVQP